MAASASGSAYLEIEPPTTDQAESLYRRPSSLKLSCTVHGPKPLPRNAAFSPQLLINTHVKYAPFASRQRRGFLRDSSERDLGAHLETALKGVVLGDRWPKSGIDVNVTVLEGEDDPYSVSNVGELGASLGHMNILAGCITAASAALVEAGVDCLDLVTGGVAAIVSSPNSESPDVVADPSYAEHTQTRASCCVAYLASRDELVELWLKGEIDPNSDAKLLDHAVSAAVGARSVLAEVLRENIETSRTAQKKL